MKTLKILLLVFLSALFIKCTSSPVEDTQLLTSAKFLAENMEFESDIYEGCKSFTDSAIIEAAVIADVYKLYAKDVDFSPEEYAQYLVEAEELVLKKYRNYLHYLSMLGIITILLLLFLFGSILLHLKFKLKSTLIGMSMIILVMFIPGFWLKNKISELKTRTQIKIEAKEIALSKYFTHNSS